MRETAIIKYNKEDEDSVGNNFPAVYIETRNGSHKITVDIDMPFYYGVVSKIPIMEHEQPKFGTMQLPPECFEPYVAFSEDNLLVWQANHPALIDLGKPDLVIPYEKLERDHFKIEI